MAGVLSPGHPGDSAPAPGQDGLGGAAEVTVVRFRLYTYYSRATGHAVAHCDWCPTVVFDWASEEELYHDCPDAIPDVGPAECVMVVGDENDRPLYRCHEAPIPGWEVCADHVYDTDVANDAGLPVPWAPAALS